MEIIAKSKHVRQSPRKLRTVAAVVKKMSITQAENRLMLLPKAATMPILKTLRSALANAVNTFKIDKSKLSISNILVDEGFRIKRGDRAHGARWDRGMIQKPTAHIKVILQDN